MGGTPAAGSKPRASLLAFKGEERAERVPDASRVRADDRRWVEGRGADERALLG